MTTEAKSKDIGRKPKPIDLDSLEKLARLNCTHEEIAAWFSISRMQLYERLKKPEYADAIERGKAKGRISVRRMQMKLLYQGNATMGIWLGKQLLGQRDNLDSRLTGADGGAIKIEAVELTDEQLIAIASGGRARTDTKTPGEAVN